MTPDGVLFDAAGTLFDLTPPIHDVIASTVADHGHVCAADRVEQALDHVGGTLGWPDDAPDPSSRVRAWALFVRRIIEAADLRVRESDRPRIAEAAARTILRPANYAVFPDVAPVIERLAAERVPVAIVSNFDDLLFDVLGHTGLDTAFDTVLTSYRTGISKPDPRIFHLAAEAIGKDPATLLYVGDSVYSDMGGARAAGMRGVLIDRDGRNPTYTGDTIASLPGLLPHLGL
ncbi:HAD family hydrolase [Streptomyces californicus]|uniref:HAD family hydrolase n=1 Tax=Streptomyces californicus TaxID=67351 RepID=UPI00379C1DBB